MPRDCLPAPAGQTVLDLLFDSHVMVFVGRLLIVAAAVVFLACGVFVLISIVARMRRGHWLKRAGPFEISESMTGAVEEHSQVLSETLATQEGRLVELGLLLEDAKRTLTDQSERER